MVGKPEISYCSVSLVFRSLEPSTWYPNTNLEVPSALSFLDTIKHDFVVDLWLFRLLLFDSNSISDDLLVGLTSSQSLTALKDLASTLICSKFIVYLSVRSSVGTYVGRDVCRSGCAVTSEGDAPIHIHGIRHVAS